MPPVRWIECKAWELDLYGLPHRIPWPAAADEKRAEQTPFDTGTLVDGIEALGPDPGDPWYGFRLAALQFEELAEALEDNEFPRARQLLDEIERQHPGTLFAQFHRAHVARHDGRIDEAIALYQAAGQRAPGFGFIWTNLGATLAADGRREEAIVAFQNAVRANSKDVAALDGLAGLRAIVKLVRDPKDPTSAAYFDIPTFAKMAAQQVAQIGENLDQLQALAEQLVREGFAPGAAAQALEKVLAVQPENGRARLALAAAYRQAGDHEASRKTAAQFVEMNPADAGGYFHLAQACNAAGDAVGEKAALEKTLELEPNLQPAISIRFGLGNRKPTQEQEKELLAFGGERRAWMPFLIASSIARDLGDVPRAVRHAARAHRLAPDVEEVLLHYCAMLGEVKDLDQLKSAIEPRLADGKFSKRLDWNFAQALKQSGRMQEAIAVLIGAASAEGAPQDFQNAAGSTIDFWNGLLVEGGVKLELTKAGVIARPILLALDDGDGGVVILSGQPIPREAKFPWRVPLDGDAETRIRLRQGQTGSAIEPRDLGAFVVKGLPPLTGGAHTLQCHIAATPQGSLVFRATLNGREHHVAWEPV